MGRAVLEDCVRGWSALLHALQGVAFGGVEAER